MKKFLLLLMLGLILVILFNTSNKEPKIGFNNYPDFFLKNNIFKKDTFDAIIVVSDNGPEEDLITAQEFLGLLGKKYTLNDDTLVEYKHVKGLYDRNAIFIGTCNTKPKNKFVNIFMDCLSMEEGVGMLRLVKKNNITITQVVGYDFKDTKKAISVLVNSGNYDLSGKEIEVRGNEPDLEIRITGK